MYTKCKYHVNRVLPIAYREYEGFEDIQKAGRLLACLIEKGAVSFKSDQSRYHLCAPCMLFLDDLLKVELMYSHKLEAKSILFAPEFINANLTKEMIQSPEYEELCREYNFPSMQVFTSTHEAYSGFLPLDEENLSEAAELFDTILQELHVQSDDLWACRSRVYMLKLFRLAENIYESVYGEGSGLDIVDSVLQFLRTHFSDAIQLEEVSKAFGTNRTTLATAFKEKTGMTVNQYQIYYKLELAKECLAFSDLPIGEIAKICGFHYESYFTKQFTDKIGVTPNHFRKSSIESRKKRFSEKFEKF